MRVNNTVRQPTQEKFAYRVKAELLRRAHRGLTPGSIQDLARMINRSPTAVSLAIHRGCYQPTRTRIAEVLDL